MADVIDISQAAKSMGPADHALVNALAYLGGLPGPRAADRKLAIDIIRDVLPYVNRSHEFVGPLADVADDILGPHPELFQTQMHNALGWFFKARLGAAWDAFQAQGGER